jgi:hypothetical protein
MINKMRYLSMLVIVTMLVLAPSGQIIVAQALSANCTASSPISGAYVATVCVSSPSIGSTLTGSVTTTATISVTGTNPGVQRMIFYINGAYLLTDFQSPYTFLLPTTKWVDGNYTIAAAALMRDGFTTQQASIPVIFSNGITTPPVNTNQFQPSSGTTPANGAPFVVIAGGDGASGENSSTSVSNLVVSLNPNLFLYLGDVYEKGSTAEFYNWYGLSTTFFDRLRSITDPTVGNHEYSGGSMAKAYFDYWDNIPNYYSFNAGGWHFISLNSNWTNIGVSSTSAQYHWLQQDLAANPNICTIAYYHHPLFDIGPEGATTAMSDIWKLLAQSGVSIVLNGHDHDYQRWVALDGNGNPSPTGITEFVVGSAGHGLQAIANSDSRVAYSNSSNPAAFGALVLSLTQTSASFIYRSTNGSMLDSGVVPCVTSGTATPTPTPTATLAATSTPTPTPTATTVFTSTPSSTPTATATTAPTLTATATSAPTLTATPTASNTPVATSTPTPTATFLPSPTASATSLPIPTATPTTVVINSPTPTAATQSLTFNPVADTYVNAGSITSNYGSSIYLRADATPDLHSYLRFSVSGIGAGTVLSARLLIYANSSGSLGINGSAVADNSWGELTTNYSNAPALGAVVATSPAFTAGTWVTLNVSSYITGDGTYSFGISTTSGTAISMASRESGANAPQLIISYR